MSGIDHTENAKHFAQNRFTYTPYQKLKKIFVIFMFLKKVALELVLLDIA